MDTELKRTASEETWKQLATRLDVELAALKASIGGEQPGQLPGAAPSAAQGELPAGTFEQPPAPGAPVAGESATSSENLR